MKRRDLIAQVEAAGAVLIRHGGKHDIYHNSKNGATQPIPTAADSQTSRDK